MGYKKLLSKLSDFLDMDARSRNQRKDELNDLLTRLKQKELKLKDELAGEDKKDQRGKISQKIDVVHTQRKKGVQMLKELRNKIEISNE